MENSNVISPLDEEGAGAADLDEPPIDQQLVAFREQWQNELRQKTPMTRAEIRQQQQNEANTALAIEEEAKALFRLGVEAEQSGYVYDAIKHYRRALQLVPDIEMRVAQEDKEQTNVKPRKHLESTSSVESGGVMEEDEDDLDDLIGRFNRLKTDDGSLCEGKVEPEMTHISSLPVEVLMYIFKWVVSGDLDIVSLEHLGMVCRGFFLCARDEELWRLICFRVWGVNCGNRPGAYGCWRNMYLQRPHLRFNGCFISKASYYRKGQMSMDNFFKPFHLVEYFRYVRFFPEGKVLMLTTPEDPNVTIPKLKQRVCRIQGVLYGYYRLVGDKVTLLLKRRTTPGITPYKYKRQQRQQNQQQPVDDSTFQAEFTVGNAGVRKSSKLTWTQYSIQNVKKSTGEESVACFELSPQSYPPLIFSRVKNYTATADSFLQ